MKLDKLVRGGFEKEPSSVWVGRGGMAWSLQLLRLFTGPGTQPHLPAGIRVLASRHQRLWF